MFWSVGIYNCRSRCEYICFAACFKCSMWLAQGCWFWSLHFPISRCPKCVLFTCLYLDTMQILETGKGTIQPGTGMAEFIVRYRAIVYRPFKGETVDGVVGNVNKVSFQNFKTCLILLDSRVEWHCWYTPCCSMCAIDGLLRWSWSSERFRFKSCKLSFIIRQYLALLTYASSISAARLPFWSSMQTVNTTRYEIRPKFKSTLFQ